MSNVRHPETAMSKLSRRDQVAWFTASRARYEALAKVVAATLEALVRHNGIDGAQVFYRAKEIASFSEKIRRKRYSDARSEMTDLSGIRVVTLIERDVGKVADIVRAAFAVHSDESPDKSAELGVDRFGYKSLHFVCDLGGSRTTLPEFAAFADMAFEIQVRTALQHAWAEIEHDRSYKFAGELPSQLKRRFHLVAGLLELADREFSLLTEELERYTAEAKHQAQVGILDLELNSTTASELLKVLVSKHGGRPVLDGHPPDQDVIQELRDFNVHSLADLKSLCNDELLQAIESVPNTTVGVIRDAMIYADIDRYFATAWKRRWQGWDADSIAVMGKKYGNEAVSRVIRTYGVMPVDASEEL